MALIARNSGVAEDAPGLSRSRHYSHRHGRSIRLIVAPGPLALARPHAPAASRTVARRRRAGALASRPRRARGRARAPAITLAARRGRAARVPAGADAQPLLRRRPAGPAGGRRRARGAARRRHASLRGARWRARPVSTCTPRCTSAPTASDGLGYNTAILVAPGRRAASRARASCTSRSPPATTRTATSGPGPADARPSR